MKRFEISPHGGVLINRTVEDPEEKEKLIKKAECMKKLEIGEKHLSDLEMIATGAFSPLEGFMTKNDYESVLNNMRLSSGFIWPIPITLDVSDNVASQIDENTVVALTFKDKIVGIMQIEEKYKYSKEIEAQLVYKTMSKEHPGVRELYSQGEIYIGGKIIMINAPKHQFSEYFYTPKQMRELFKEKNWSTVAAFQTRNPIHRAHEYIQKCALETVDGLLIHPIVGWTKNDDIPADIRMECYKKLIEIYYPKERVILAVFPTYMRYAGPREAVFHAIVRKNYGCTHMIIGRDHAGVGNYYGTYEAQELIKTIQPCELMIVPMMFDNAFYCNECHGMATKKTCPHPDGAHVLLSGTNVRKMLNDGIRPPEQFIRPEISKILIEFYKNKGSENKQSQTKQKYNKK